MPMEIPRHWRLKDQRYHLIGTVCPLCDTKAFPGNGACRTCEEIGVNSKSGDIYNPTITSSAKVVSTSSK